MEQLIMRKRRPSAFSRALVPKSLLRLVQQSILSAIRRGVNMPPNFSDKALVFQARDQLDFFAYNSRIAE